MAKTAMKLKAKRTPKYSTRAYTRCERCGRPHSVLRKYKLEPKNIKLIYPKINKEPNLVLIKATKCGKPFLKMEKPLIVYNEDGTYTDEILKIYGEKE